MAEPGKHSMSWTVPLDLDRSTDSASICLASGDFYTILDPDLPTQSGCRSRELMSMVLGLSSDGPDSQIIAFSITPKAPQSNIYMQSFWHQDTEKKGSCRLQKSKNAPKSKSKASPDTSTISFQQSSFWMPRNIAGSLN